MRHTVGNHAEIGVGISRPLDRNLCGMLRILFNRNAGGRRYQADGSLYRNAGNPQRMHSHRFRNGAGAFVCLYPRKDLETRLVTNEKSGAEAGTISVCRILPDGRPVLLIETGNDLCKREERICMKKIMAVYDEDPFYAERLSDYVNRKEKGIFKAQAFTSRERLELFAKETDVDVLLTGVPVSANEIEGLRSTQTIHLTEEKSKTGTGADVEIYKYQSGDDIIREVMAVYCENPNVKPNLPGLISREKRIIGVYSPVGRCGKTSLALSIGQVLAKEEKVLFITMDMFSGFSFLLDEQWKRDLSDLLYYYKQGRFHGLRLNPITYYLGDMAWLPPFRYPDDYSQITAKEMAGFLVQILNESIYETIVLDIGDFDRPVLPVLEVCKVVYMPIKEDPISQAKVKEFETYVERFGTREIQDKFHKIHVPLVTGTKRMERFPQELLWGDMGDFVRGLLKGQRNLWEQ